MLAKDLLSNEIPVLSATTSVKDALLLMDEFRVNVLPLVDNSNFVCLLSEKELLGAPDPLALLGTPVGFSLSVKEQTHLFDALDRFTQSEFDLLPVIDNDNNYKGSITRKTILKQLAIYCDSSTLGSIIHIELNQHDFILSEIARLAEQNNAHIINVFTYIDNRSNKLKLFIKVDQENAMNFLRSLERFNYNVVAHYHKNEITNELMQQRIDELLYYLEM